MKIRAVGGFEVAGLSPSDRVLERGGTEYHILGFIDRGLSVVRELSRARNDFFSSTVIGIIAGSESIESTAIDRRSFPRIGKLKKVSRS